MQTVTQLLFPFWDLEHFCFLEDAFVQILWEHLTMQQQEPKALSVITLAIWSCIISLIMGPLIKCINRFIQDNNFNDFITNLNEEHLGNIKLKPQTCWLWSSFFFFVFLLGFTKVLSFFNVFFFLYLKSHFWIVAPWKWMHLAGLSRRDATFRNSNKRQERGAAGSERRIKRSVGSQEHHKIHAQDSLKQSSLFLD